VVLTLSRADKTLHHRILHRKATNLAVFILHSKSSESKQRQQGRVQYCHSQLYHYYYFASAAVTVDSSHIAASSSTSWSRFSPPSNYEQYKKCQQVCVHPPTMAVNVTLLAFAARSPPYPAVDQYLLPTGLQ